MEIIEQAYGGNIFRPSPEIHYEKSGDIIVIATPWGQRSCAKKAIDIIVDYFLSANTDMESTTPFEKDLSISAVANNLRTAALLANNEVLAEFNSDEYRGGCELLLASCSGNEFSFVQVGQPQVFWARKNFPLIPLAVGADLSLTLSPPNTQCPPIPRALLGLESTLNLTIQSYSVRADDRIILLSRSLTPPRFLSYDGDQVDLDQMVSSLVMQDENMPFWLGIVNL